MDVINIIYIFLIIALIINLIILIYNIIIGKLDKRTLVGTILIIIGAFSIHALYKTVHIFSLLTQNSYNTMAAQINILNVSDSVKYTILSDMQQIYLSYQIGNHYIVTIYPIIFIAFIIIGLLLITKMDKLIYNKIKEWIENK